MFDDFFSTLGPFGGGHEQHGLHGGDAATLAHVHSAMPGHQHFDFDPLSYGQHASHLPAQNPFELHPTHLPTHLDLTHPPAGYEVTQMHQAHPGPTMPADHAPGTHSHAETLHTAHLSHAPEPPPAEAVHQHHPATGLETLQQHPIEAVHTTWDPAHFHGIGHPLEFSHIWQLQTQPSCAVMAQADIYQAITGQHLTEQQACQIAQAHGWYDPQTGTPPEAVGNVLNYLGIPTEHHYHSNLNEIADALEHNQPVMVGLNANEIWHPYHDAVTGEPMQLKVDGHVVWVAGMDQGPDGTLKLILNDTGTPGGRIEAVDARDFLNAWADEGNFIAIAHPPATSHLSTM
jgi:hypothetical protein